MCRGRFRVEGRALVVVRIEDDVYVLDDRCSHEDFSLAEGEVNCETAEIECAPPRRDVPPQGWRPGVVARDQAGAHYDVRNFDGRLEVVLP